MKKKFIGVLFISSMIACNAQSFKHDVDRRLETEARKSLERAYNACICSEEELKTSLKDHPYLLDLVSHWEKQKNNIDSPVSLKEFIDYALSYEKFYYRTTKN